jgi:hypothetical protein
LEYATKAANNGQQLENFNTTANNNVANPATNNNATLRNVAAKNGYNFERCL